MKKQIVNTGSIVAVTTGALKSDMPALSAGQEHRAAEQAIAKERFFKTARAIQQDNKDANPQEVLRDVRQAVEADRK